MTTIAAKVCIAQKLMDNNLIKTPDQYIEFLNADLGCENSLKLIYKLVELETGNDIEDQEDDLP